MGTQRIEVSGFENGGIVRDSDPFSLAPAEWSGGCNVRFDNRSVSKILGETTSLTFANSPLKIAQWTRTGTNADRYVYTSTAGRTYLVDAAGTETEITKGVRSGTADPLVNNIFIENDFFNGGATYIVNDGTQIPQYIQSENVGNTDASGELQDFPLWLPDTSPFASVNAGIVRPFRNYIVAANLSFLLKGEYPTSGGIALENFPQTTYAAGDDVSWPIESPQFFGEVDGITYVSPITRSGDLSNTTVARMTNNTGSTIDLANSDLRLSINFEDQPSNRLRFRIRNERVSQTASTGDIYDSVLQSITAGVDLNYDVSIQSSFSSDANEWRDGDTLSIFLAFDEGLNNQVRYTINSMQLSFTSTPFVRAAATEVIQAPSTIRVSNVAQRGSMPNWDATYPGATSADQFDLDTGEAIIEMLPLSEGFIAYTPSDSFTITVNPGSSLPITVSPDTVGRGMLSNRCGVEFFGRHFVVGPEDIYLYGGGATIQSVADGRVRDYFFSNLNRAQFNLTHVLHNRRQDEIWICYPKGTSRTCTEALIWNYVHNTWTIRFLTNIVDSTYGRTVVNSTFSSVQHPLMISFSDYPDTGGFALEGFGSARWEEFEAGRGTWPANNDERIYGETTLTNRVSYSAVTFGGFTDADTLRDGLVGFATNYPSDPRTGRIDVDVNITNFREGNTPPASFPVSVQIRNDQLDATFASATATRTGTGRFTLTFLPAQLATLDDPRIGTGPFSGWSFRINFPAGPDFEETEYFIEAIRFSTNAAAAFVGNENVLLIGDVEGATSFSGHPFHSYVERTGFDFSGVPEVKKWVDSTYYIIRGSGDVSVQARATDTPGRPVNFDSRTDKWLKNRTFSLDPEMGDYKVDFRDAGRYFNTRIGSNDAISSWSLIKYNLSFDFDDQR